MRRAAKTDDNQTAIVDALRDAGCKVLSLAACGNGVPDLLVHQPFDIADGWEGGLLPKLILLEVKNLDGRGKKLTPEQVKFHAEWPVTVVTSPEEALAAVGLG